MRVFYSKVDRWLVITLTITVLLSVLAISGAVLWDYNRMNLLTALMVFAAGIVLVFVLIFSLRYEIKGRALVIRFGPMVWRIPLKTISEIRETTSCWPAPALSIKRLEVRYGDNRKVFISPRRRRDFLHAIRQKSNITIVSGEKVAPLISGEQCKQQ